MRWRRVDGAAPGVVVSHRAMVAGWELQAELVMTGIGALQLRVNGENVGPPMIKCTLRQGQRRYRALLRRLSRPRQLTLPL